MSILMAYVLFLSLVTSPLQAASLQQSPAPTAQANTVAKPSPVPNSAGNYSVGNGVSAPILISSATPEITDKMRKKKLSTGSCVIGMVIKADGSAEDVHLVSSIPDTSDKKLRDAVVSMQNECVRSAKQDRFKPAIYLGKPVPVELKIEIQYMAY